MLSLKLSFDFDLCGLLVAQGTLKEPLSWMNDGPSEICSALPPPVHYHSHLNHLFAFALHPVDADAEQSS